MPEPFAEPDVDVFICEVGALLKKHRDCLQDGPELQAVLSFFKTHGYSHIADDLLSVFPTISAV